MTPPPHHRRTDWQPLLHLPDLRVRTLAPSDNPATPRVRPRRARSQGKPAPIGTPSGATTKHRPVLRVDPPSKPHPAARQPGSVASPRSPQRNSPHDPRPGGNRACDDGNPAVGDEFLIDHARDLIRQLAEWSLKLDRREQQLDARERDLERRARTLRQLQWLVAAASQSESVAAASPTA